MLEHVDCPQAKEPGPADESRGLCVTRITKEQSQRFEAAMEPFKKHAIPLESYSVADWPPRPDGKPCKSKVTDAMMISLTWTGTEGAKIANFYTGCDSEEFGPLYKSILGVTAPLPIQQIIDDN